MPLSRSRDYMSIGEVLEALKPDFDDITISKIRFLESEGLIAPERTASGYRKFYPGDVERLRHILTLQRDHFMPLKVIKQRLEQLDAGDDAALPVAEVPAPVPSAGDGEGEGPMRLSRAELLASSGLSEEALTGLQDFGLLDGGEPYDDSDLLVARAARRFLDYGIEPRHLRMYRQFVDREAAVFEQVVSPVARKHDPRAQEEAARSMSELLGLARQIHEGALRASLRQVL